MQTPDPILGKTLSKVLWAFGDVTPLGTDCRRLVVAAHDAVVDISIGFWHGVVDVQV